MFYIIDYRNGGMGYTITAHTLFSCNKLNVVDIDKIFSVNGDAHALREPFINQTELRCNHDLENPRIPNSTQLLSVVCEGWDEVLRKKMSYHKHYEALPTQDNLDIFEFKLDPTMDPLEFLTITYFDSYNQKLPHNENVLYLGHYLEHKLEVLQRQVKNVLGWQWDNSRSETFHKRVLAHNQRYISWLDSIRHIVNQTLKKNVVLCDLKFWEKAIVISMSCQLHNVNPSNLRWNDLQFLTCDNQSLIDSLHECSNAIN